ncbi:MAG TPA: CHAT domain-containing protein [Vicinamibacterales bacterium]|nr:CHAT domain-containing protein [Vicinamibacterales bacterium]
MPVHINSPGWKVTRATGSRGVARSSAAALADLPPDFLAAGSRVVDEVLLEPEAGVRTRGTSSNAIDLTCDVRPGHTAAIALRMPSGALTFHRPVRPTPKAGNRAAAGKPVVRFRVTVRPPATRGIAGYAVKVIVVEVVKLSADNAVALALPRLAEAFEKAAWKRRGLKEGWVRVTKETLESGILEPAAPASTERSLLFIHGTFSDAAAAFRPLTRSRFFERVASTYGDRIFAFNHFSVSRTPEENARMLLAGLPDGTTTFDVVTHSRGGLVLRNLSERAAHLGTRARRFKLGRAVLVASPNEGTPLATPKRWEDTVGWVANLLEMLPDNPFTTGASFVANGIVWLANHASGGLPGLHSMDADGELIAAIQMPPGPARGAYSALVANYHPTGDTLRRLVDMGIDGFFQTANDLVVPSEGGWRTDRSAAGHVPASRVGCFGPGGNLPADSVTHGTFFSQPAAVDFIVNSLLDQPHRLARMDVRKSLPARNRSRGISDKAAPPSGRRRRMAEPSALRITVINGDLTYVSEPLLIGHYRSSKLTGAEAVMDRAIGEAMTASLERGLYPGDAGTHQIFVNTKQNTDNPWQLPRPAAVIVAGLGGEGELRGTDLVDTVRQAVIAWGQRLTERPDASADFSLATTLLGSGGTGISAGQAAQLIAQGLREANEQMSSERSERRGWPRVSEIHIIELYLDRATEAWRSLQDLATASPAFYAVNPIIEQGIGALRRPPDGGYRGADYDFISALVQKGDDDDERIVYTIDTKRARSEVRAQATQLPLIRNLISTASNSANADVQIGQTLFSLLVPVDLEPFMASSAATVIQVDSGTAAIPWELLDSTTPRGGDDRPWAIRTKLLRKLRTDRPAGAVNDASADDSVLVIGDPACDRERYPRLLGARREAMAVAECLNASQGGRSARERAEAPHVTALISPEHEEDGVEPDANDIINATMSRSWRIIHIAGHGEPPATTDGAMVPRGVVLSNESYLGPAEIGALRVIPELVFVNCCHLASSDAALLLKEARFDRAQFASGVAEALIKSGVRCVVAAGWAVDDEGAYEFATTFYSKLLGGSRFIDAVAAARVDARERGGNTWAAYQCYGDPDWRYRRGTGDAQRPTPPPPSEELAGIPSLAALLLTLDTLAVKSEFQNADGPAQAARLEYLETSCELLWRDNGEAAEAFGNAWAKTGNFNKAIEWYERAQIAPDGTASLAAIEQVANLKVRRACEEVTSSGSKRRVRFDNARREIAQAIGLLDNLISLGATVERESLYGSAYKRLALIEAAAGRHAAELNAIANMKDHYEAAERIARADVSGRAAGGSYYPAMNRIAARLALEAGTPRAAALDAKTLAEVQKAMLDAPVDFWSVVGQTELKMYASLFAGTLKKDVARLIEDFNDHHGRVSAPKRWASVLDNASFVLLKYQQRASRGESEAAARLLTHLTGLAARAPASPRKAGNRRENEKKC